MDSQPTVRDGLVFSLFAQSILLLLFSTILDGGVLFGYFALAGVSFWVGVVWMIVRCRGRLSNWQTLVIRIGWIPIMLLAAIIISLGHALWQSLGIIPRE